MVKKTTTISTLLEIILKRIERIEKYTEEITFDYYVAYNMLSDACERNIEIIGDSCKEILDRREKEGFKLDNITAELFRDIYAVRAKITHGYDHIDDSIVFSILKKDIKDIKPIIQKLKENIE